jgi:hypothetical protein
MTRRNQHQNGVEPLKGAPDMVILQRLRWAAQQDVGIMREGGEA